MMWTVTVPVIGQSLSVKNLCEMVIKNQIDMQNYFLYFTEEFLYANLLTFTELQ